MNDWSLSRPNGVSFPNVFSRTANPLYLLQLQLRCGIIYIYRPMKPVVYPLLYALLGMSNMLDDRRYQGRRNRHHHARVAQLAERLFCKQRVAGSSPVSSSTILAYTFFV